MRETCANKVLPCIMGHTPGQTYTLLVHEDYVFSATTIIVMKTCFIAVLCLLQLGGSHGAHLTTTDPTPQDPEPHCSCEGVIQAAIANATAEIVTNITSQLERDISAKFQQQSEFISSQNDELSEKILRELFTNIQHVTDSIEEHHPGAGTIKNPATSCSKLPHGSISGDYWIQSSNGSTVSVYCDMGRECCGLTGGWMRVGYLDMTDDTQECPAAFRSVSARKRMCGTHGRGCVSMTLPVEGLKYSHVCGRIKGYQYGSPNAFHQYYSFPSRTIDNLYVEGVSLTHGQHPRKHIWTFAAAIDETYYDRSACPCTNTNDHYTERVPTFIGQDYFCDTGSRSHWSYRYYLNDPLWDGEGCGPANTCCEFNHPPWFCKEIPEPTTDDIEMRLCVNEGLSNEDVLLEQYEIFIQ